MKNLLRCMLLLMLVGLVAAPGFAAELRTTGFIDNVFPHWERNISDPGSDNDATRNHDSATYGRTRGRMFFNFIASDDLRGVFGIELDAMWGAPRRDLAGSGCIVEDGAYGSAECGFRQNNDINNFELKHLYVDFRIPQLPIGNRTQLGGLPIQATPLHGQLIMHGDFGGGVTRLTFTDQVSLLLYYAQLEENVETFNNMPLAGTNTRLGEDYWTGGTLMLKPIDGLDLHLVGVYGHLQNPFGTEFTGQSGAFHSIQNDTTNVTTESRYYLGFDSRYRIGNLSLEPFFVYLLGTRNFCSPGSTINTNGDTRVACTSPVGSPSSTNFNAYVGSFVVRYVTGPWLLQAKYAYASGNRAGDDINNRGNGKRSDVKGYRPLTTDGSPIWDEWFEILGRSEVDGTSTQTFRRWAEAGTADRFGWQVVAVRPDYQFSDNLTLEGAAGAMWTAGMPTACPAVLRSVTTGACTGGGTNSSGQPIYNFTGQSNFLGWEVDVGFRYTIMPGLTWTPRVGYADYGEAYAANNRHAQGAWFFANRMIYIF
jgi:hypothetical protein